MMPTGPKHRAATVASPEATQRSHLSRAGILLGAAFVAACATPATRSGHVQAPAPCVDSVYVQLKREHPDSLSERAWQRLQSLDRDCAGARAQSHEETSGMMGMSHGRSGAWMGLGIVTVIVMAVMMTAIR